MGLLIKNEEKLKENFRAFIKDIAVGSEEKKK